MKNSQNRLHIKGLHLTVWVDDEAIGMQLCRIYNSKNVIKVIGFL